MSKKILADERISGLSVTSETLNFYLADGRILSVPLDWFPRLASASPSKREAFEIVADGFVAHWPELDEDIEISGLLAGNADPSIREIVSVTSKEISSYRKSVGISQRELAEQLGVRQATVSDWEKNKSLPSPLAKSKLCELIRKSQLHERALPPVVRPRLLAAAPSGPATWNFEPIAESQLIDQWKLHVHKCLSGQNWEAGDLEGKYSIVVSFVPPIGSTAHHLSARKTERSMSRNVHDKASTTKDSALKEAPR